MDGTGWPLKPPNLDFSRLLGPAAWARLHPDIRRRFAPDHPAAIYRGRMALWCSALGRAFALLARVFGTPLSGWRARDLKAIVRVEDDPDGVVWTRDLHADDGRITRIRSIKRLDARGALIECVDGGLGMNLALLEHGGALVFESRGYFVALGRWRVPIPAAFTPGRCRVAHHALGPRRFRFTLDMTHPWWGRTFTQDGVFEDPEEP